ncbi:MAG: MACPF domain-containing protein [Pirellulales bacterium]|nr:MACPF domain-containing protein [Pirellulales bacterium]
MSELIPGYSLLGRSFDTFGTYTEKATESKQRLFDLSKPSKTTFTYAGKTYDLPVDTSATNVAKYAAQLNLFHSKSEVSEFFSAQAGIEGKYLAYSAQFDASYSSIAKTVDENYFGLFHERTDGYQLSMNEATVDYLTKEAQADLKNLPNVFNESTKAAFFQFFDRYGAFYVTSVTLGGRLYYNFSVKKSYVEKEQTLKAKVSGAYEGLLGAKANAKAKWNQSGKDFVDAESVSIHIVGGKPSSGLVQAPQFGENRSDLLGKWLDSVPSAPAAVEFGLAPLYRALPLGEKANALETATDAYTQAQLYLEATGARGGDPETNGTAVICGNHFSTPKYKLGGGALAIVVDRSKPQTPPLLEKSYDLSKDQDATLQQMYNDLNKYTDNEDVIVAMLWFGADIRSHPTPDLHGFMRSIGAGDGLTFWDKHIDPSYNPVDISYALVGVPGWRVGRALETYDSHGVYTSFEPVYPGTQLESFLKPENLQDVFRYTPT